MAIRSQLEDELVQLKERRDNRSEEHAYQHRLKKIEEYYDKLKAEPGKREILPIFSEFQKLPIIKRVQTTHTSDLDLQNEQIAALLKGDLDKWRRDARSAFAKKLGLLDWKTASSLKLHPIDRLSALFSCTKCVQEALQDQTLNFEDACMHQCMENGKKKRQKQVWDSDQFVPHEKVRASLEVYMTLH